jgi:chromosome segregation ATPase
MRLLLVVCVVGTGALLGAGAGYGVWGLRAIELEREVAKLNGWIVDEMRGSDERLRAADARIRQLEADLQRVEAQLADARDELRAERQRRRLIEERLTTLMEAWRNR